MMAVSRQLYLHCFKTFPPFSSSFSPSYNIRSVYTKRQPFHKKDKPFSNRESTRKYDKSVSNSVNKFKDQTTTRPSFSRRTFTKEPNVSRFNAKTTSKSRPFIDRSNSVSNSLNNFKDQTTTRPSFSRRTYTKEPNESRLNAKTTFNSRPFIDRFESASNSVNNFKDQTTTRPSFSKRTSTKEPNESRLNAKTTSKSHPYIDRSASVSNSVNKFKDQTTTRPSFSKRTYTKEPNESRLNAKTTSKPRPFIDRSESVSNSVNKFKDQTTTRPSFSKKTYTKEPNESRLNTKTTSKSYPFIDRSESVSKQSVKSSYPKPRTSMDYLNYQIEGIPILSDEIPSNDYIPSFQKLGLNSRLCSALAREDITTPTPIQIRALPHTLTYHHKPCIVQSETGTGKTLVYLLPALQDTRPGLTTLIVTPTRELAIQVYLTAKKLAGTRKDARRVSVVFSGHNEAELLEECRSTRPHILVGTPKILEQFIQEEPPSRLAGLQRLIIDEGDNLMKSLTHYASWAMKRNRERHPKSTRLLTQHLLKERPNLELICTSATIPKPFREELIDIGWGDYPTIISTIENSKVPECISHQYIECSGEEKLQTLVDHFRQSGRKQALVFIHRKASIDKFIADLTALGINARPLYLEVLDMSNYESFLNDFRNGVIEMVVGTEETVRGLDFSFVETLYMTEVPRTSIEYLHMAGRVGRMGKEGLVVTLVEKEEEETEEEIVVTAIKKNSQGFVEDWRDYEREDWSQRKKIEKTTKVKPLSSSIAKNKERDGEEEKEGGMSKLVSRLVRMYNMLGVTNKPS